MSRYIKQISKNNKPDYQNQEIDNQFLDELKKISPQQKALFVDNSLLADDLIYASFKYPRLKKAKNIFVVKFNNIAYGKLLNLVVKNNINLEDQVLHTKEKQLLNFELNQLLFKTKLFSFNKKFNLNDLEHYLKTQAPHLLEINDAEKKKIVNYINKYSEIKNNNKDWHFTSQAHYELFAEVNRDLEDSILNIFHNNKAKIVDNILEVQEYKSVHNIQAGKRLKLKENNNYIYYTPHKALKYSIEPRYKHIAKVELPREFWETAYDKCLDGFERRIFSDQDLVLVQTRKVNKNENKDNNKENIALKKILLQKTKSNNSQNDSQNDNSDKDSSKTTKKAKEEKWQSKVEVLRWMRTKNRDKHLKALKTGETFIIKRPHITLEYKVSKVNKEVINKFPDYWVILDDNKYIRTKNYMQWQKEVNFLKAIQENNNCFQYDFISNKQESNYLSDEEQINSKKELSSLYYDLANEAYDNIDNPNYDVYQHSYHKTLNNLENLKELKTLIYNNYQHYNMPKFLRDDLFKGKYINWKSQYFLYNSPLTHNAPFSERGIIKVETKDINKALKSLEKLGLFSNLTKQVPYNIIYNNRTITKGKLTIKHNDYLENNKKIELPSDYAVLHGLTGSETAEETLKRLNLMVKTGGLQCISQRRHLQLGVASMSPRGDIASGIDWGVPCKIGNITTYGSFIYFILKPEILERRDLFFAPCDYGGGHNRYDEFSNYAKSIGQEKIFIPASHETRMEHINNNIKDNDNEVYFKDQVSFDEVDSLVIQKQELYNRIKSRVENWKLAKLLPESLEVILLDDTPQKVIGKRAKIINKKYLEN